MKREQDDISLTPEQIRKVGSVLQRLRLKGGHKLQVLATMGNISVATLSNIENGKDHVTVEKIEVYCKLLNTSLQYVLELIETDETLNSKDLRYLTIDRTP